MKSIWLKMEYKYWCFRINACISWDRLKQKIHSKWILRKGERTEWSDVWRELDKSKRSLSEYSRKLRHYANKRDLAVIEYYG